MAPNKNFTESSGNVFADLGVKEPEEMKAKAQIAFYISQIINHRHLTQKEAASYLGLTQPKVSKIMSGHLEGFSLEKLMLLMMKLNRDIKIMIKKKPKSRENALINVVYA